jgi:hypothetical protein
VQVVCEGEGGTSAKTGGMVRVHCVGRWGSVTYPRFWALQPQRQLCICFAQRRCVLCVVAVLQWLCSCVTTCVTICVTCTCGLVTQVMPQHTSVREFKEVGS